MTTLIRERTGDSGTEQFHTKTCICGVVDCSKVGLKINHKIPRNPKIFWRDSLYGFEKFKNLNRGTATLKDVEQSSLGLKGWKLYGKRIKHTDRINQPTFITRSNCIRLSELYIGRSNQDDYKKNVELLAEHEKIMAELMFKVAEYNQSFLDSGGNRVVNYSNSQRYLLIKLTKTIKDLSDRLKTVVSKIINLQIRKIPRRPISSILPSPGDLQIKQLDTKSCNIITISGIVGSHSGLNGTYRRESKVDSNGYHRYKYVSNGGKYGLYSEVFLYRWKNTWLIGCKESIPKGRGWICLKHIEYNEWKNRKLSHCTRNKWISISKEQQINPTNPMTLWFSYNSVIQKWVPKRNIISVGMKLTDPSIFDVEEATKSKYNTLSAPTNKSSRWLDFKVGDIIVVDKDPAFFNGRSGYVMGHVQGKPIWTSNIVRASRLEGHPLQVATTAILDTAIPIYTHTHIEEPVLSSISSSEISSSEPSSTTPVVRNIIMNIQRRSPPTPEVAVYDPAHFCQSWATCCEENLKLQPKETVSRRVTRSMTKSRSS